MGAHSDSDERAGQAPQAVDQGRVSPRGSTLQPSVDSDNIAQLKQSRRANSIGGDTPTPKSPPIKSHQFGSFAPLGYHSDHEPGATQRTHQFSRFFNASQEDVRKQETSSLVKKGSSHQHAADLSVSSRKDTWIRRKKMRNSSGRTALWNGSMEDLQASLLEKEMYRVEITTSTTWPEVWDSWFENKIFWVVLSLTALMLATMSLSGQAVTFILRDELKVDLDTTQRVQSFTRLPVMFKIVYAWVSDSYPIFHKRRKWYICLFSIIMFMAQVSLAILPHSMITVALLKGISELGCAGVFAVSKAVLVDMCDGRTLLFACFVQVFVLTCHLVFLIPMTFVDKYLLEYTNPRYMLGISSVVPVLMIVFAINLVDTDHPFHSAREQLTKLKQALLGQHNGGYPVWKFGLFMLLMGIGPTPGKVIVYWLHQHVHFSQSYTEIAPILDIVACLIALFAYLAFLSNTPIRKLYMVANILLIILTLWGVVLVTRTNIKMGIPDDIFVATSTHVTSAISQLAGLPLLVFAVRVCPPGVEGVTYALLMSLNNLSDFISSSLSLAFATALNLGPASHNNWDKLPCMWVISAAFAVFPVLLIWVLFPLGDGDTQQGVHYINENMTHLEEYAEGAGYKSQLSQRKRHNKNDKTICSSDSDCDTKV